MLWNETQLQELIIDISTTELRKQRPSARITPQNLEGDFLDPKHSLNLDSLELFQIATQVALFFQLHETDSEMKLLEDVSVSHWITTIQQSRNLNNSSLTFQTSGSTGQPKLITHSLALLSREAELWASYLDKTETLFRTVPTHHIYGFIFTILLPQKFGLTCQDARQTLAHSLFTKAPKNSLIITLPEWIQAFNQSGMQAGPNITAITSTAPCPTEWQSALIESGIAKIGHIYGSSETRGIGVRWDKEDTFELLPFIKKSSHDALKYITENKEEIALDVQDNLSFCDENHFTIAGRKDNLIQVGGYNISPQAIKEKLRACSHIKDAEIRPFDSPTGTRLKAFIVPQESRHIRKEEIQAFIQSNLRTEERPVDLAFGDEVPTNTMGKPTDWPLQSQS